jgi:hypothetical protein
MEVRTDDLTGRLVSILQTTAGEFDYIASVVTSEEERASALDTATEARELIGQLVPEEDAGEDQRYVICLNHIERALAVAKTIRRGDSYARKYTPDKGEMDLSTAYAKISARRPIA